MCLTCGARARSVETGEAGRTQPGWTAVRNRVGVVVAAGMYRGSSRGATAHSPVTGEWVGRTQINPEGRRFTFGLRHAGRPSD